MIRRNIFRNWLEYNIGKYFFHILLHMSDWVIWFKDCSYKNKHLVGGKCSSLGELHSISKQIGFSIGDGFAITTKLYDEFITVNQLQDTIDTKVAEINAVDIQILETQSKELRDIIMSGAFTEDMKTEIVESYRALCKLYHNETLEVAVRSSALAEDLPNASFAGQHDTFLNVSGEVMLLDNVKECFASLFNTRAVSYRKTHNIPVSDVKISVAVQKMIRSDIGSAGVAFSLDPETGYNKAIVINSAFGLGELVVSGGIKPDEFILDKRVLRDIMADPIIIKKKGDKNTKIVYGSQGGVEEVETNEFEKVNYSMSNHQIVALGRYVLQLEVIYSELLGKPTGVDVEWAIDGTDHNIYIIQTRPETIHSNDGLQEISNYILEKRSDILVDGVAVGDKISTGRVKYMKDMKESAKFQQGDILVTEMTTPDWEPIMKISSGIITDKGGRTCHAAIVARELGLNAVVGCSNATSLIKEDTEVTLSCAEGETGYVYDGILPFHVDKMKLSEGLKLPVKVMLNVGNPESSFENSLIPNSGVGLARLEFIVSNYIKIHPLALYNYPDVREDVREQIYQIIGNYDSGKWYYIKRLAKGIAKIASAFYPNDVIVRLSDFKSNEYRNMIGGELYEPHEENPMIGWRGASRYYSEDYENAFQLECEAIKYAREKMQMENIVTMIPFCRTPEECRLVTDKMASYGLVRGENKLRIFLMCEIPSNVIEADKFSPMIDGVSIGGNDLLQLTLGVDRDSDKICYLSDDKNISYRRMIQMAIQTYKEHGVKVGFCGQQPSDSLEFCQFLINENIDTISVTPDSALKTIQNLGTLTKEDNEKE
jgi:pyruvate, water dikinase